MGRRSLSLLTLFAALGAGAPAQVIPIRTVPLVQGDQYLIFPSNNLGRGGVSIALADSLLDPFRNPAFGARVGAFGLFSAPTIYSSSRQTGGGRTLPLGVLGRTGAWFGALSATIQQVEASRPITPPIIFQRGGPVPLAQDVFGSADRSHGNSYVFASLGKVLTGSGLSLGGSMLWSGLRALDGVDLLYPDGQGLTQSGHGVDLRLGLLKQWPRDRSLEVLVLHKRFRMTHDVTYLDLFWDPGIQQFVQSPRVEHNLDRNTTTGLHVAYQRPLSTSGWRLGWIGTVNYLSHPRIAQNEIVTIPRDQGHSAAYNLGIGLSKTRGLGTFGLDAIYEPIWSTSWAVADGPMATARGDTIPAGGRIIVNRFHFSNAVLRLGVSRDLELVGMQRAVGLELGLAVRAMHYRLVQSDKVAATEQPFQTGWVEWSPTWGLSLRFPEFALRYRGRVVNGTGRPAALGFPPGILTDVAPGNFVVVPGGTLDLAGVTTVTHQISLSLPLR